jgi:hypothetical protein
MVRTQRLILALCSFSIVASAQEDPLAWFPLQRGTRWLYQHESKSGNRNRPNVDRWTSEETIVGWVTVPEGLVVLREAREQGSSTGQPVQTIVTAPNGQLREVELPRIAHRGYLVARDREPYLVRGNCVYVIGEGWDPQNQRLRPNYQRYVAEGALPADFCFPLQTGRRWGNNDVPWIVEPSSTQVGSFLPAEYADAMRIFSSHFGSGGQVDVWFKKGVGVVGEHYIHNGTYDEYTKKLLSFSR